jgi:hypothetical protein
MKMSAIDTSLEVKYRNPPSREVKYRNAPRR